MNNTRNFTNDISNKASFISLKNEINKKIKETLFDDNSLFLSLSFNYYCSNYKSIDLIEEGKNISNILDNISTNNEEDINENYNYNSNSVIISEKKAGFSHGENESKKKLNESLDEKSSSFGSKIPNLEEKKNKYKICLLSNNDLLHLLNINNNNLENKNDENKKNANFNINKNELNDLDKEKIKLKINDLENKIKSINIKTINLYLRKMVCLKLFKALNFGLKNFNLKENEIKIICLYIEAQARIFDNSMTNKYKEFIENIFKYISCENKNNI